eukprot:g12072.t1
MSLNYYYYSYKTGIYQCEVEHFCKRGAYGIDPEFVEWILKVLWPSKNQRKKDKNIKKAQEYVDGLEEDEGICLADLIGEDDPDDPTPPAEDPLTKENLANIGMKGNHIKKIVRHLYIFFSESIQSKNKLFENCTKQLKHYETWATEFDKALQSPQKSTKKQSRRVSLYAGEGVFPVNLQNIFRCLKNINMGDLGAMYDNFKLEEDAGGNTNINKSDAKSVQTELSHLVEDEASKKYLLNSREHLKNAVELICPSWRNQLIDDGLYRIYSLNNGFGYYVSKFYFDQVRDGKLVGYKIKD